MPATSLVPAAAACLSFTPYLSLTRDPYSTLTTFSLTTTTTMDAPGGGERTADLTWENVGLAFSFIIFDAAVSRIFQLGVGTSLVTAAVRCVIQLTLVSLILQKVFEAKNPWGVAGIACECPRCVA